MTSERKRISNILNAQKSMGPRTERGPIASSRNALKHGRYSNRLKIEREDSLTSEIRLKKWQGSLDPQDDMEEFMVFEMVANSVELDAVRTRRLDRRKERIEKADDIELKRIEEIGEALFHDPCGPAAIYGTRTHDWRRVRTSWSGKLPDPSNPSALVTACGESEMGCIWLLTEWSKLYDNLEISGFFSR